MAPVDHKKNHFTVYIYIYLWIIKSLFVISMWIIIITNRITQNEQQINLTYEGYYSNYYLLDVWGWPWESIVSFKWLYLVYSGIQ